MRDRIEKADCPWKSAMRKTNRKWSRERITEAIRERFLAGRSFRHEDNPEVQRLHSAAQRYFGSWRNAVEAAGFDYDHFSRKVRSPHNRRKAPYWSRQRVVEEIKERKRQGASLRDSVVRKEHPRLASAGRDRFGSWGKAIEAAGIDYEKILLQNPAYPLPSRLVLKEIRKRARKGLPLDDRSMRKDDRRLFRSGRCRFGGWREALEAAGFDYHQIMLEKPGCTWSRRRVVKEILDRAAKKKALNLTGLYREGQRKLYAAGCKYFGSWRKAVEAAGLDYDRISSRSRRMGRGRRRD